jgi:hypothetical protein
LLQARAHRHALAHPAGKINKDDHFHI